MRNVYLMFVSWFFYYKTSGLFLLILAFITLSDWLIARQIHKSKTKNQKSKIPNILLALSVTIDLGLLAYFKYAYFFTNAVNDIFGADFRVFDIFAYIGNGFAQAGRFSVDTIILPVGRCLSSAYRTGQEHPRLRILCVLLPATCSRTYRACRGIYSAAVQTLPSQSTCLWYCCLLDSEWLGEENHHVRLSRGKPHRPRL